MKNSIKEQYGRRRVLQGLGALAVATQVAPLLQAADRPAGVLGGGGIATDINSEWVELAPNVYAWLQREAPGQSNFSVSNFGAVAGPSSMLAIDAGGGPEHARNFIKASAHLGKPFDRIVITHEHPDHIVGLTQFPEGIEVIAQELTRDRMVEMGQPNTPAYWATNPAWGRADDVNRIILPTVTFRDRMSVYYGDVQVDFVWPGRAHTQGDALIYLPREKIVFLGDIGFFEVTPLNGSGYIREWIEVCDDLLADPAVETIVPGHGPIGGKAELKEMRDYLVLIYEEGKRQFEAGVSAGRAAAELDLGKYATWTDADRLPSNMARLYAELNEEIGVTMDFEETRRIVEEYNQLKGFN